MFEVEVELSCPYCAAPITMLLDPTVPAQRYVEDCEVCCNPIEVAYTANDESVTSLDARSIEQ
ncbi:CPXCG motif-containing cysteine-rich protein [Rubrivirga sp. S365]|uniref:CPXCG motif-containing cysteine-rich protein n=1 Tax=Rubrivirga litoralis TaxID=3075598 RepID=A0ABU3BVH7_9BACT|nr:MULTISPECIES: CPXCG motif-containing cysteine-rich protein [unclassified Rubrivirga]MDT0633156.1 CPXCG motif-containing cysteine-rich protein [Rubrivirga sp. F394]MDT7857763.1 CPXCG motif-containing cysteine-rich protein [Rubrivirga sp. S365]